MAIDHLNIVLRVNKPEFNIILAALRYWQRCGGFAGPDIQEIATDGETSPELDSAGIDALCERINGDEADKPTKELNDLLGAGDALYDQVGQMRGMFNDDDGTIQAAVDAWEEAKEEAVALRNGDAEPELTEEQYKAICEAAGWRYVMGSDIVEEWCGDRDGIVHEATLYGRESHNDSVYATWKDCFREALGGKMP